MDVLSDIVATIRLRTTLYCRVAIGTPWGLTFSQTRMPTFHVVDLAPCWLTLAGEPQPTQLACGDVVVLCRGSAHTIGDVPGSRSLATIALDEDVPESCQVRDFRGAGEVTNLLCGFFDPGAACCYPLFDLLPPLIHLRGEATRPGSTLGLTLQLLGAEAEPGQLGRDAVVQHLTDVLLVQVIRAWAAQQPHGHGRWLGALSNPQVGAALAAIHERPADPWTVARLARYVALSRSAFAARFTAMVGMPPLRYLTAWRIARATALLRQGELSLAAVAARCGYESAVGFSRAFKRETGVAPSHVRMIHA